MDNDRGGQTGMLMDRSSPVCWKVGCVLEPGDTRQTGSPETEDVSREGIITGLVGDAYRMRTAE